MHLPTVEGGWRELEMKAQTAVCLSPTLRFIHVLQDLLVHIYVGHAHCSVSRKRDKLQTSNRTARARNQ